VSKSLHSRVGRVSLLLLIAGAARACAESSNAQAEPSLVTRGIRAPAVPLIACDPYFSIWSPADHLADADTTHWTGKPHRLTSLVSIDKQAYRLLGREPANIAALEQTSLSITPTRTKYTFAGGGVEISLTFTTPSLPEDIDLLSRPITFVTYSIRSRDGQPHDTRIYFEASAELTVNSPNQMVVGSVEDYDNLKALKMGSQEQAILGRKGDDLRIDWGYFYLASSADKSAAHELGEPQALRDEFVAGQLERRSNTVPAVRADRLSASVSFDLHGAADEPVTRRIVVAYDDLYSIEYMHRRLQPYWRRNGLDAKGLLLEAEREYPKLIQRCDKFDQELIADLERTGGREYANLAVLAYRQCFAAGKFVADANGQPLQFCKENHSNGCISTSDVFYPMSPQFLLFGPSLTKSFVVPFMNYAASDHWKFAFAPHDLGTYPMANGQVYGGGERTEKNQMPVEESGNLLILMAAVAKMEGHARFAEAYWPQLAQWAAYLKQKGFDPENQLCTDDFAGHLAHNVNLSAKSICALGAFAQLCKLRGDEQTAHEYRTLAEQFASRWVQEADDGDHFRLAFDKPGTWSQKYNLVWDRVLGLNLFPESVARKELAYYRRIQNRYGLPLDNRKEYTKLDWTLWTATLTQDRDDFRALVGPVCRFLDETPDRSPLTDWYRTDNAKKVGFTARPVVGGVFMPMLYSDSIWSKWSARAKTKAAGYAAIPPPPKIQLLVAAADSAPAAWRFTNEEPRGDWTTAAYDDTKWREGRSGFGTANTPGARIGTVWNSSDIWLRRKFDIDNPSAADVQLNIHHDEDAEIYINGVLAQRVRGFTTDYEHVPINSAAARAIRPTGDVLAVHCHQTTGGQFIDVGLVSVSAGHDSAAAPRPSNQSDYPLKPVPFNDVEISDNFWRPRLETQRKTLVPFALKQTEVGLCDLQAAADFLAGKGLKRTIGERYRTSDLFKVVEGAAYLLHQKRDPALESRIDEIVTVIAAAQEPDGYLYPAHTMKLGYTAKDVMGEKPYSWVAQSHELYNMGHLYEAAVSYYQATGNDNLLKVAEKNAQHVNRVFFEGDPNYNDGKPVMQADGHPEVELALVKLFRTTGNRLYLDMARKFLEIRGVTYRPTGRGTMAPTYAQQHLPVLEQREPVGHAVRAMYLYSAMADVGTLTDEKAYQEALEPIWRNIVDTRMHITGGVGAVRGIEGFGAPYDLPNAEAYDETCAAVGNIMFNHRMFLLTKEAKYLDVAEVALLNNVLAGVNFEGNRFFYVNPLAADGKSRFNQGEPGRAPWFGTACCPSNLARLLPQVPGMVYAHEGNDLYITFFAGSKTRIDLDVAHVGVQQETNYPEDGKVVVRISPEKPCRFRVLLRVPTWTRNRFLPGELYTYADELSGRFELRVNGKPIDAPLDRGFAVIEREWQSGDRLELDLPMPLRAVRCHPDVKANRNRLAFTRGPLVLCAEGVDNGGATQSFFVGFSPDTTGANIYRTSMPSGSFLQAAIPAHVVNETHAAANARLTLTPYYAWNNRGVGPMTVWFPEHLEPAVKSN